MCSSTCPCARLSPLMFPCDSCSTPGPAQGVKTYSTCLIGLLWPRASYLRLTPPHLTSQHYLTTKRITESPGTVRTSIVARCCWTHGFRKAALNEWRHCRLTVHGLRKLTGSVSIQRSLMAWKPPLKARQGQELRLNWSASGPASMGSTDDNAHTMSQGARR